MSDSADPLNGASLMVRSILPADAAAVAELSGQLGYEVSTEAISQRIVQISSRPDSHTAFVACIENSDRIEIVGWIEATLMHEFQSPPYIFITGLVVSERHRSFGIGKRLCAQVEAWSRKQGITTLRVTSRISREGAHRFYLREGFERIKTWAVFEKMLS